MHHDRAHGLMLAGVKDESMITNGELANLRGGRRTRPLPLSLAMFEGEHWCLMSGTRRPRSAFILGGSLGCVGRS